MSKHHKKRKRKKPVNTPPPMPKAEPKSQWKQIGIIMLVVGLAGSLIFGGFSNFGGQNNSTKPTQQPTPVFQKHGTLTLSSRTDSISKTLEIEIVETKTKIQQGLMYRPSMRQDRGMLFVFPDNKPRSFWMKNTPLPLDIVFIGENKAIVAIQANTTPFSETSLPSNGKSAKYVLEVNAGFMFNNGFKVGDKMDFFRD